MTQQSACEFKTFQPRIDQKMEKYLRFLLDSNQKTNLTSITNWEEAVVKHLQDSMAIILWKQWDSINSVIDLGTGPGLPGIPLAIAHPKKEFMLLETNGKKVKFLNETISYLQLNNVTILHGRAEDIGRKKEYREKIDLVLTRAVASLPVLLELAFPLIQVGGYLVAYKGPEPASEIEEAQQAQELLYAKCDELIFYQLNGMYGKRSLIAYKKKLNTPSKYPRRPGIPEKNPL